MKIINIIKLRTKYKIEFDTGKDIYISENTLIKFNILSNKTLTSEFLEEIKQFDYKEQSFSLAVNYLSYGSRTEKEVVDYLSKKNFSEEEIDYTLKKLIEYKYIDDKLYTELYIKDKIKITKKGPYYIKNKLIKKGVSKDIIEEKILSVVCEEDLVDNAYDIINKEFSRNKLPKKKRVQKITTKLYTNGYSFDIINKAFEIFFETYEQDDIEEEIIGKYFEKAYDRISRKYENDYIIKQKIIEKLLRDGFSYDKIKMYFEEIEF